LKHKKVQSINGIELEHCGLTLHNVNIALTKANRTLK